jgi:raffinose/stachyose/melibiose transport system substrate-binding protein
MKAKRITALVLAGVMTAAALMTGCGGSKSSDSSEGSASSEGQESDNSTGERKKITALLRCSETSTKYIILKKLLTEFSEEKGLEEPEFELVSSDADYVTKLQLYINSNALPDIYGCANGALSSAAKDIGSLVNIGDELERIEMKDDMNQAVYDFFKDADDGNVYLFPESLNCEFFMYRKDIFEQYGLEVPTTWDEFLQVCSTLKENEEIPLIVAGKENWQLMRYLSFAPWRMTKDQFISGYIDQTEQFSTNTAAQSGANLLYTLGTEGYYQGGFLSTDYTAATDLFFGGTGAMWYSGSGQIAQASEMYANGELGFFPVPDVEGEENMETNIPIHGGFGTAFNAQTYDETMQEFFQYMCENYSDACYNDAKVFSPFNDEIPEGLDQMFYDLQPLFASATDAWVSWDDKLDSATLTNLVDEQQKLAQGKETPEEFEAAADQFIVNNSK